MSCSRCSCTAAGWATCPRRYTPSSRGCTRPSWCPSASRWWPRSPRPCARRTVRASWQHSRRRRALEARRLPEQLHIRDGSAELAAGRWGALAVPNYRTYFIVSAVSQSGGWLLRTAQAWLVLALAAVLGIASAFDQPARSVFVSQLVGPRRIGNAVALNSAVANGARIVGPGVGGVMIALWGTGVCFSVAAVAFLVAT